ncbi:MAG: hypothetical protein J7K83_04250 [Candidatus Aenigmarchaeota archaeon]|nr:hypothetical protein [Candidatus Aenigmarchaeota archaeon]
MSILFVTRHFSEGLFPLIVEIAKQIPVTYVYFSNEENEFVKNGVEIKQLDESKPEKFNDLLAKLSPSSAIFSSVKLVSELRPQANNIGVIVNEFVPTKVVANFNFVLTFFSTLEQFYKGYVDVVKISPFIDMEKIENLRKQRISKIKEFSSVHSFTIFADELSDEFHNLIRVLDRFRSNGANMSVNVITREQAITNLSHISFIKRPVEENKLLSLLSLSDISFFVTQNVFDFVRAFSVGNPVVVSSRTFLFEYVWNGKNGFVISFEDERIIETVVKKAMDKLSSMTKRAQKDAMTFDVKQVARDFLNQLARKNLIEGIEI